MTDNSARIVPTDQDPMTTGLQAAGTDTAGAGGMKTGKEGGRKPREMADVFAEIEQTVLQEKPKMQDESGTLIKEQYVTLFVDLLGIRAAEET
jgi:hypothetical protein